MTKRPYYHDVADAIHEVRVRPDAYGAEHSGSDKLTHWRNYFKWSKEQYGDDPPRKRDIEKALKHLDSPNYKYGGME